MKNKFLKAIIVLTISLLTFSCTEDPIAEIPSNYLKYNGKYYDQQSQLPILHFIMAKHKVVSIILWALILIVFIMIM